MRLVAVSILVKNGKYKKQDLVFYNLSKGVIVKSISNFEVSVHSLAYKHDYMLLATATYHTEIQLWGFKNNDINKVGELKGHTSQVTTVGNLVNTPLLITADEGGVIKTWDVRKQNCIQTFKTESKNVF